MQRTSKETLHVAMSDWPMEEPAKRLCERLSDVTDELPREIIKIDSNIAAIVIEQDGVDYILTMIRLAVQRDRPSRQ